MSKLIEQKRNYRITDEVNYGTDNQDSTIGQEKTVG